jgi:hypothetical protein
MRYVHRQRRHFVPRNPMQRLRACTGDAVPPIPGARGTPLTKAQAAECLAEQRAAALAKDRCAKAW